MALATLQEVKDLLGVSNASQDSQLAALMASAEVAIKNYCGREFGLAALTEFYSGDNTRRLALRQRPVTSVTAVYLDHGGYFGQSADPFPPSSLLTPGVDWALDLEGSFAGAGRSGVLVRLTGVWPAVTRSRVIGKLTAEEAPAPGNIKVVYAAGFSQVPSDLKLAQAQLVRWFQQSGKYGGAMQSESLGDAAYSLAPAVLSKLLPAHVEVLLAPYREMFW